MSAALGNLMTGAVARVAHSRWTLAVGAALVHFLWEAGLVAVVLAAVQPVLRRASAKVRYGVSCAALFSLPAIFAATVVWAHMGAQADAALGAWLAQRLAVWLPVVVGLWALGVVVSAGYAAGGWLWLRRVRRQVQAAEMLPREWRDALARLAAGMGFGAQAAPRMALSEAVEGPCVVGWLRPLILMPVSAVTAMPIEHVEALLAHELAHIRRNDYLVNLAQRGVEVMFFFHPAVWWLGRQVAQEREQCCDDAAIAVCGNRIGYARALVELAGHLGSSAAPRAACAAHGGSLRRRVRRIVSGEAEFGLGSGTRRAALATALGGVMTLGLVLTLNVGMAMVRRESASAGRPVPAMVSPRIERVALRTPVPAARVVRKTPVVTVTPAVLRRAVVKPAPAPARVEQAAVEVKQPARQAQRAPVRRQIVTVEYAAFESCGPTLTLVQQVTPTGELWTSLEPVVRCVPVIQPMGIVVKTL